MTIETAACVSREAILPRHLVFPNLSPEPMDVLRYVQTLQT